VALLLGGEWKMRKVVTVGALLGVGLLIAWARGARLHERLMARCEAMFERMPDTFPPKRAMGSIEETRVATARILHLLESRTNDAHEPERFDASSTEAARHAG
jgi:hypothetical protein